MGEPTLAPATPTEAAFVDGGHAALAFASNGASCTMVEPGPFGIGD